MSKAPAPGLQLIAANMAELYRTAPIGLCVFDRELRYVVINEWLAKINGLPVDKHVGRRIQDILPAVSDQVLEQFRSVLRTGAPLIAGTSWAVTPAHPDVTHRYQHNYVAIRDEDGSIIGVNVMVQDLGECEAMEPEDRGQRPLTRREAEVLGEVGRGGTSREIADRLGVSVRTVDAHRRSLSLKLNLSGSNELAEFARRAGLI